MNSVEYDDILKAGNICFICTNKSNPAGLNLDFEMSVPSDLGGRWDVPFLPAVLS